MSTVVIHTHVPGSYYLFALLAAGFIRVFTPALAPLHELGHVIAAFLTGARISHIDWFNYVIFHGGIGILIYPAGMIMEVLVYNLMTRWKWTSPWGVGFHGGMWFLVILQIGRPSHDIRGFRILWFLLFYCLIMAAYMKRTSRIIRDREGG